MERLIKTSLEVGMSLPWTVFTEDGEVLLNEGSKIKSDRVLGLLIGRGAWCLNDEIRQRSINNENSGAEDESYNASAFEQLDEFSRKLHQLLTEIVEIPKTEHKDKINEYAGMLQNLIWKYTDMILGALILDKTSPYSHLHPIMSSAISAMIAKRKNYEPDMVHLITCANITANLGMFEFQDALSEQEAPLNELQKQTIHGHPQKSVEILKSIGVTDKIWLDIVFKQHEKLDGSGYPNQYDADSLPEYVRISTLADVYAAMVLPRKYRDGIHCQKAIKNIFSERASTLDESLANLFIKDIGIYPPGAWVELSNGDKGIVIKRGLKSAKEPTVSILFDSHSNQLERPRIRRLDEGRGISIKSIVEKPIEVDISKESIWGFI